MKARSFGNTFERGYATVELLIAFAVLALVLTALIILAFGNQSLAVDTQVSSEALAIARNQLESAQAAARGDFYGVTATSSTLQSGPLRFTTSLALSDIGPFRKQATSTVSWTTGGRSLETLLSTIFTDPMGSLTGDTCSPEIVGDWTAPQDSSGGYAAADINSSTGATGVAVAGQRVYIVSDPSASSTDDFYVFDASNPKPGGPNPTLPKLGSFSTSYGLTDIQVSGRYAYVSADTTVAPFLVIDKSDPAHLSRSSITGSLSSTGPGETGNTVTYDYRTQRAYLGTTKGFYIVDVSHPATPTRIGSFYVGSQVNQIVASGTTAYVASASSSPLIMLDISNVANITETANLSDDSNGLLEGKSILLSGSTLYFGRDGGGNQASNYPQLYALNASDLGIHWSLITATNKNDGVNRMVLRSNLLFVASDKTNGGFEIYDISNPFSAPPRYDTTPLHIPEASTAGFDCEGNLLFVGERSQSALQVIGPS